MGGREIESGLETVNAAKAVRPGRLPFAALSA
jgi:hypothetical protein